MRNSIQSILLFAVLLGFFCSHAKSGFATVIASVLPASGIPIFEDPHVEIMMCENRDLSIVFTVKVENKSTTETLTFAIPEESLSIIVKPAFVQKEPTIPTGNSFISLKAVDTSGEVFYPSRFSGFVASKAVPRNSGWVSSFQILAGETVYLTLYFPAEALGCEKYELKFQNIEITPGRLFNASGLAQCNCERGWPKPSRTTRFQE